MIRVPPLNPPLAQSTTACEPTSVFVFLGRKSGRVGAHDPALGAREHLVQTLEPVSRSTDLGDQLHQRLVAKFRGHVDQLAF